MLSLGSNTRIFLYAQVADPTDGSLLTLNACPLMAFVTSSRFNFAPSASDEISPDSWFPTF
jgi:hypothetical protein